MISSRSGNSGNFVTVLIVSFGCLGWMIVLFALSAYHHSSSSSGSSGDAAAPVHHHRYYPSILSLYKSREQDDDDNVLRSTDIINDQLVVSLSLEKFSQRHQPSASRSITTAATSQSSHRQLSKHLKQFKEEPSAASLSIQPVVIDYTQFSCDSMNDPDLVFKLHEQQQQFDETDQLQLKKKKRKKRKKKKKKRKKQSEQDLDAEHEDIERELQSTVSTEDGSLKNDKLDATLLQTEPLASSSSSIQQQNEEPLFPVVLDKCQFAKTCNDGEGVGFGASLFCSSRTTTTRTSSDTSSSSTTPPSTTILTSTLTILLLLTTLLLLFRLLNSTTDEFFSPGLEHFSLQLGLPPRFAGVTLLALGNGAPDVAATMNATLDSTEGYLMALGELTGTSMFVSGVLTYMNMTIN